MFFVFLSFVCIELYRINFASCLTSTKSYIRFIDEEGVVCLWVTSRLPFAFPVFCEGLGLINERVLVMFYVHRETSRLVTSLTDTPPDLLCEL